LESKQRLQVLRLNRGASAFSVQETATEVVLNKINLQGELDLSEFSNLQELHLRQQDDLTALKGIKDLAKL
jgi:hypothetical protein